MAKEKLIGVHWVAKSYITDVELLDREVESTYFRLLQYIYIYQDRLPDDDEKLARLCKCKSVREYRAHKAELMVPRGFDPETGEEIPPRIEVKNGLITNRKCTEKLAESSRNRHQKSGAGKASSDARKNTKPLENNNTASTAVPTATPTEPPPPLVQTLNLKPKTNRSSKNTPIVPISFSGWYAEYPRKVARDAAEAAYAKAMAAGATADELLDGARRYAVLKKGCEAKHICHPSTWLNNRRWRDEELQAVDLPETPEHRAKVFYGHWLKTGAWLDDKAKLEDVPDDIRMRCEVDYERESVEAAGQQKLAL